jgi:hypothetical protein
MEAFLGGGQANVRNCWGTKGILVSSGQILNAFGEEYTVAFLNVLCPAGLKRTQLSCQGFFRVTVKDHFFEQRDRIRIFLFFPF